MEYFVDTEYGVEDKKEVHDITLFLRSKLGYFGKNVCLPEML